MPTTFGGGRAEEFRFCRVDTTERWVGTSVVVARPADGEPLLMNGSAAIIWQLIGDCSDPETLVEQLAEIFPDTPTASLTEGLEETRGILVSEGLLERRRTS